MINNSNTFYIADIITRLWSSNKLLAKRFTDISEAKSRLPKWQTQYEDIFG